MRLEIRMPRASEFSDEGTIARWRVSAGDVVSKGDVLAEADVDMGLVEVKAEADGKIVEIWVHAGQSVPVDTVVAMQSVDADAPGKNAPAVTAASAPPGDDNDRDDARLDDASHTESPAVAATGRPAAAAASGKTGDRDEAVVRYGHILASAAAIQLAEQYNINLENLTGTGSCGRIEREDVEAAMQTSSQFITIEDVDELMNFDGDFSSDFISAESDRSAMDEEQTGAVEQVAKAAMEDQEDSTEPGVEGIDRTDEVKADDEAADPEAEAADMEEETAGLEAEAAGLEEETAGLEEETAGLEDETGGLEEETAGLEDKTADLEDEAADLEDEAAGLEDEAADLEDEAADLEDEAADLEDEAADLEDEAADLEDEAAGLEDEGRAEESDWPERSDSLIMESDEGSPMLATDADGDRMFFEEESLQDEPAEENVEAVGTPLTYPGGQPSTEDPDSPGVVAGPEGGFGTRPDMNIVTEPDALEIDESDTIGYDDLSEMEQALAGAGMRHAETATGTAPEEPAADLSGEEGVSDTGKVIKVRRILARKMEQSWRNAPHFFVTVAVDMTDVIRFRNDLGVTINDFILAATARSLREHPWVNALFVDDEVVEQAQINLSVAVETENGLYYPVVRDCAGKSLKDISAAASLLVHKAHSGQLTEADVEDGTFTISNMGMLGVESFGAIITPPQVAVLAVGTVKGEVIVDEHEELNVAPMVRLTLSADHRALDGADAADFLGTMKSYLEAPITLVAPQED